MTKKIIIVFLLAIMTGAIGYLYAQYKNPDFKIKPPCTMCYMEANKWNNYKAGSCACDDLIAQGKDPCPQCQTGLCEEEEKGACKINE